MWGRADIGEVDNVINICPNAVIVALIERGLIQTKKRELFSLAFVGVVQESVAFHYKVYNFLWICQVFLVFFSFAFVTAKEILKLRGRESNPHRSLERRLFYR